MRRATALLTAGLLLSTSLPATADQQLSYSYWEADYVGAELDAINPRLDGFGTLLSVELPLRFFLFGSYMDTGTSSMGEHLHARDYTLGAGYAYALMPNLDVNVTAGYANGRVELAGQTATSDGYTLGLGVRSRLTNRFELEGVVRYVDFNAGNTTQYGLDAQWYFTDQVALSAFGTHSDKGTIYGVGLRGTWGRRALRESRPEGF